MAPDSPPDHSNFKSPARRLPPMTLNSSPDVDINAEHLTSQRPVKRRLDFSMETALPSVEMPPTTTKSPERKHDRPRPGVSQSPLKQVTSLNQSKARPKPGLRAVPARTKRGLVQRTRVEDLESDSSLGSVIVQQVSEAEDSLPQVNGHMDSYENPEDEYDQVRMDDDDDAHLQAQDVEDSLQELYRQAEEGSSRHYDTSISSKRKRGKPPKPAAPIAAAESVPKAAAPKKGRGKSRKPSEPVYDDIRPTKRRKENINPLDEQGPSKRPKATKAKLTRRDPNAKMASTRTRNVTEEFSDEADAPPAKPAPGKKRQEPASYESNQRSNWQAREDVPERDPRGAQITRSGRPAVKPMEYWRNERAIYSDGNSLQAIVRTEAVNPPKRARGRPRGSKNKAEPKAKTPADTVVVEEDDKEPWEEEPGIINGYVRQWDEELATGVDDVVAAGPYLDSYMYTDHVADNPNVQKSHTLRKPSRPGRSPTRPFATPRRSPCPFSVPAWSICRPAESRGPRTRARCRWCFLCFTAKYASTSLTRRFASARAACGRFLEVCLPSFFWLRHRSFRRVSTQFSSPFHVSREMADDIREDLLRRGRLNLHRGRSRSCRCRCRCRCSRPRNLFFANRS